MLLLASALMTLQEPTKLKASPRRASPKREKAKCTTPRHLWVVQSASRILTVTGANHGGIAGKVGDDRNLHDLRAVSRTSVV